MLTTCAKSRKLQLNFPDKTALSFNCTYFFVQHAADWYPRNQAQKSCQKKKKSQYWLEYGAWNNLTLYMRVEKTCARSTFLHEEQRWLHNTLFGAYIQMHIYTVHVCTCTCEYMHRYTCTCIYPHVRVHMCTCTHVHWVQKCMMYVRTNIYMYMHVCVCVYKCVYVCLCVCAYYYRHT